MEWVISYQKIFGWNSVKCLKVEKISDSLVFWWVWWVWRVREGNWSMVGGSVNSGYHELSERVWFELFKVSQSGENIRLNGFWRGFLGLVGQGG